MNNLPINLVVMLEEKSAEEVLQVLMPKILPRGFPPPLYIAHAGKDALQKSLPIKLRSGWPPNTFFVIVHDQDSHDCRQLKSDLRALCQKTPHAHSLIRIICEELEAWYLGDLEAVAAAFPGFRPNQYKNKAKYRQPDTIVKPSKVLEKIVGCSKKDAYEKVPQHMDLAKNTSPSFHCFVSGVQKFVKAAEAQNNLSNN